MVATGFTNDDVPVIVLYGRTAWNSGFDVPALLVWADGMVVHSEGRFPGGQFLETSMAPADVLALGNRLRALVRGAPMAIDMTKGWTDQPSRELMVRDGDAWHVVHIYGGHADARIPTAARDAVAAFDLVYDRIPTGGKPASTSYPRPPSWPDELPSFRGQRAVDRITWCASQQ